MVDGQLRPNRITEPRLLTVMGALPREDFLPPGLLARAYVDEDVRLPGGRALMEPMIIARLIQLLALRPGDRVLVAGAGTGYAAAILAGLGGRVTAVEADAGLLAIARPALAAHTAPGAVTLVEAPPAGGHPAAAPFDAILIEGAIPALPDALVAQLAEGGRLAAILAGGAPRTRAVLGRRVGAGFGTVDAFDCATLPLPGFATRPSFVF
ncbi:protein-L-isoaspartate(D-aspartate) O-methyltransferase [Humitalea rosea]|uniref:Protein-L-isoaspartate O-methyltransferase n=2 Tax=Humitalea rosea TaxID=990373 RepID=A0A2W7IVT5_9PROT|nr:protein-L-isoaspartate(D-aspartate) O-methyltransferase [Humitalea rosea]